MKPITKDGEEKEIIPPKKAESSRKEMIMKEGRKMIFYGKVHGRRKRKRN